MLTSAYLAAVFARLAAARPERVWLFALMPMIALVVGRRTRFVLVVVVGELAALWLTHALLTLIRAARLEGG